MKNKNQQLANPCRPGHQAPRFVSLIRRLIRLAPIFILVSALAVIVFMPEVASAQANAATPTDILNNTYAKISAVFKVFMDVISVILWPILLMIGGLLQNDIIFGGGMEDRLLLVWREVRNIVNIFFVVGLLGLAFYNVLGVGEDKIKSVLPKLIIGIIAVNFTFLAGKVVLDVANVATVSLFAIPQSIDPNSANVMPSDPKARSNLEALICTSLYDPQYGASNDYIEEQLLQQAKIDAAQQATGATAIDKKATQLFNDYKKPSSTQRINLENRLLCKDKKFNFNKATTASGQTVGTTKIKEYFYKLFNKYDANNAALTMAINLQKLYNIKKANFPTKFSELTVHIIFSLVLFVIYGSAYVALFAILLVRVVVIWICLIFSPILIFSSDLTGSPNIPGLTDAANKLYKAFIDHVKAPIIIAATMTVGYIMLKAFQGGNPSNPLFNLQTGDFNLATPGLLSFKEILLAIATCAIVWMGVFAAGEGTIAQGFTEGLKNVVGGFGKFLLKSPLYLPLLPIRKPGAKGLQEPVPIASALEAVKLFRSNFETSSYKKAQALIDTLGLGNTPSTTVQGLITSKSKPQFLGYVKQVGKGGITNITASEGQELIKTQQWKDFVKSIRSKTDRRALETALTSGQGIQHGTRAYRAWQEAYRANQTAINNAPQVPVGTTPPAGGTQPTTKTYTNLTNLTPDTTTALTSAEQQLINNLRTQSAATRDQFIRDNAQKLEAINNKVRAIGSTSIGNYRQGQNYESAVNALTGYIGNLQRNGVTDPQAIQSLVKKRLIEGQRNSQSASFVRNNKTENIPIKDVVGEVLKRANITPTQQPQQPNQTPPASGGTPTP